MIVSYSYKHGFGRCVVKSLRFPSSADDLGVIEKAISANNGAEGVIVLNVMAARRWWEFWK